jgi:hypothetical protein
MLATTKFPAEQESRIEWWGRVILRQQAGRIPLAQFCRQLGITTRDGETGDGETGTQLDFTPPTSRPTGKRERGIQPYVLLILSGPRRAA